MKALQLKTEPFNFIEIQELSARRCVNCHSVLKIKGIITEKLEQEYINYCIRNDYPQFNMIITDEEVEQFFFDGFITQFSIEKEGRVCVLSIEVASGTYRMELNEHLRFYQDKNQSYDDIISDICDTYPNCKFLIKNNDINSLNEFTIQFLETDWQFLKRLASRYHTVLVPEDRVQGVNFYMGLPELKTYLVNCETLN